MSDLIILFFLLMIYGIVWMMAGYYIGEGSWMERKEKENE